MVKCHHEVKLNTDSIQVWEFIEDWSNWVEIVPGYKNHKIVSKEESIWKIHGEIGSLKKDTHIHVRILEVKAPSFILFTMDALKDQCIGKGSFHVKSFNQNDTIVSGNMELTIKGWKGTMLYPIVKQLLPKILEDFMEKISTKIETPSKQQRSMRVNIPI
ncbi:CoxG family protein [Oceanobacillus sp. 1P07AA]|uniref:CoxG family protein n=1 Tax=Oceanobacillus sp. 1P07AA TaxID=3132293 RepID=UPI0039A542F8